MISLFIRWHLFISLCGETAHHGRGCRFVRGRRMRLRIFLEEGKELLRETRQPRSQEWVTVGVVERWNIFFMHGEGP